MMPEVKEKKITAKDYASDQDVKWCPGCGDYSILKQVQSVCAELALKKDETVFISGIGCSSRFPYYMDTYGMHSIHGRGPAFVMGLKTARPELNVWMITGDGDSMSIGGNHFIHLLRRNVDVNVLLFNNQIYGLTKGQYSPTSEQGKVTKSTPYGSIDHPFNPLSLAMGAEATFVARTMDRDPKHMRPILIEGEKHRGTSLIEIYQNCNIFNDGAFFPFTEKTTKADNTIFIEHGKPLLFGAEHRKAIVLDGFTPKVVNTADIAEVDLWIHDKHDRVKASILTRFFDDPREEGALPRPFGIFYQEKRPVYEEGVSAQVEKHVKEKGGPNLNLLLEGPNTWTIK